MFLAIVLVPVVGMIAFGGGEAVMTRLADTAPNLLDMVPDTSTTGIIGIISALAWGVGYFGQPHILVRFMAIGDPAELKKSKHIAMTWVVISLAAAVLVGLVGKVVVTTPLTGADSEKVFLVMSGQLFPPFATGLILSAVFGRRHEYGLVPAPGYGIGHFQRLLPHLRPQERQRQRTHLRQPSDSPHRLGPGHRHGPQSGQLHPDHGLLRLGWFRCRLRPDQSSSPCIGRR